MFIFSADFAVVIVLFLLVGNCVIYGSMAQTTHSIISSLLNLIHRMLVLRFVCRLSRAESFLDEEQIISIDIELATCTY